jgi:hypothetical protein
MPLLLFESTHTQYERQPQTNEQPTSKNGPSIKLPALTQMKGRENKYVGKDKTFTNQIARPEKILPHATPDATKYRTKIKNDRPKILSKCFTLIGPHRGRHNE